MLAVADESFFSSSSIAVLTNGLLSFNSAIPIGNDGYDDDKISPSIVFSSKLTATAPKFDSFKASHSLLPLISGQAFRHKSLLILRQITLTHTLGRDSQKNNNDDNDNNNYADTVSSRSNTSLSHSKLSFSPLSSTTTTTNYGFFFEPVIFFL